MLPHQPHHGVWCSKTCYSHHRVLGKPSWGAMGPAPREGIAHPSEVYLWPELESALGSTGQLFCLCASGLDSGRKVDLCKNHCSSMRCTTQPPMMSTLSSESEKSKCACYLQLRTLLPGSLCPSLTSPCSAGL